MRLLIAEDDPVSRRMLDAMCRSWGYEVIAVEDGKAALEILLSDSAPALVILDWMMPEIDGLEVLKQVRARAPEKPSYIIVLTARAKKDDIVRALDAEADDYVIKPFDYHELRARIRVGARVVGLQAALGERVTELEKALSRVKSLQGLLPMCSYCKRIRNDRNYWQQVESYIAERSEAEFTHGVCPHCYETIVKPELDLLREV
ncbi:MAG TPA: response regulator transcription factor [Terriglobia bacterium]|nr:response regulator transcription factor [Terriglobia bacterium]